MPQQLLGLDSQVIVIVISHDEKIVSQACRAAGRLLTQGSFGHAAMLVSPASQRSRGSMNRRKRNGDSVSPCPSPREWVGTCQNTWR